MHSARTRRRLVLTLLTSASAGALAFSLTACTGDSPTSTPTPTAQADEAPIFASDEEALAAAEKAYAAYLEVHTEISARGGENASGLSEVVAPPYLDELLAEFESMKTNGFTTTGRNVADRFSLVSYNPSTTPESIQVYLCLGVGDTRIFDKTGSDVTPADRQQTYPFLVSFEVVEQDVLLSKSELWTGDDFCA